MKTICLLGAAVLAVTAWGADNFHPLDVKTGLWETTVRNQMSGMPALPPDMLNRLTPEQRAKVEAAMKAHAAQAPRTTISRSCMTREKLDKPYDLTNQPKECTHKVITSNSSKQEVHFECAIGGGKQTGTVRVEAVDSENIKGTMQINMAAGERTSTTATDFSSKWLRSSCSEKDEK
ncbi:MAG TPA: DUF3617 family protein [Bryobacteraceae bacterium]|nr:DUF3617 family protein [Bryobacteraceae bacterium]